ncbi:Flocculation suppression protein [Coemansia sp. RSA 1365]|nr:Flocculation suppression protein [Coemansia sp. RSA 1365]
MEATSSSSPGPLDSTCHTEASGPQLPPLKDKAEATASSTACAGLQPKPRLLIQKTHAAFVSKLYAMVADSDTDNLISWTTEGDCFKVTDPPEFSQTVLPSYFKHGNWQSFVRQLNMYGFHKINDLAYGGVFGDAQLWMFKHPHFQRDQLNMLQKIKRRGAKPVLPAQAASPEPKSTTEPAMSEISQTIQPVSSVPSTTALSAGERLNEVSSTYSDSASVLSNQNMGGYIEELKDCIAELQQSNVELRRENQEMRTAITGCQSAFAGIMRFLETAVVQPHVQSSAQTFGAGGQGSIADAFRRMTSDIAPIMFATHGTQPSIPVSPFLSASTSNSTAATASVHSFRFKRDLNSTLPPIRSESTPQSRPLARVPSLSPPNVAILSDGDGMSARKRRLSSSSGRSRSSSACGGSGESNNGQTLLSTPQVVLPPISGMVDGISYSRRSPIPSEKVTSGWYQQCQTPLQSSLRHTLPTKRYRFG